MKTKTMLEKLKNSINRSRFMLLVVLLATYLIRYTFGDNTFSKIFAITGDFLVFYGIAILATKIRFFAPIIDKKNEIQRQINVVEFYKTTKDPEHNSSPQAIAIKMLPYDQYLDEKKELIGVAGAFEQKLTVSPSWHHFKPQTSA